jgi:hypothetical protein
MASKVEVAFYMLSRQGHKVQAVVHNNGAVWFDIDGNLLVSCEHMSEFADGLHTLDELRDLHNERNQVVFKSA